MTAIRLDPQFQLDPTQRLRSPGDVLRDDYMLPAAMTATELARPATAPGSLRHPRRTHRRGMRHPLRCRVPHHRAVLDGVAGGVRYGARATKS